MKIIKQLRCNHEFEVTDSQGYSMECIKCGVGWSVYDTWGEKFNPLSGYFTITERIFGFLFYKYVVKANWNNMSWNRLELI